MSFYKLPPELHSFISHLYELNATDLRNVRQCSRYLCEMYTPALFSIKTVDLTRLEFRHSNGFHKLDTLIQGKPLSAMVTTLVIENWSIDLFDRRIPCFPAMLRSTPDEGWLVNAPAISSLLATYTSVSAVRLHVESQYEIDKLRESCEAAGLQSKRIQFITDSRQLGKMSTAGFPKTCTAELCTDYIDLRSRDLAADSKRRKLEWVKQYGSHDAVRLMSMSVCYEDGPENVEFVEFVASVFQHAPKVLTMHVEPPSAMEQIVFGRCDFNVRLRVLRLMIHDSACIKLNVPSLERLNISGLGTIDGVFPQLQHLTLSQCTIESLVAPKLEGLRAFSGLLEEDELLQPISEMLKCIHGSISTAVIEVNWFVCRYRPAGDDSPSEEALSDLLRGVDGVNNSTIRFGFEGLRREQNSPGFETRCAIELLARALDAVWGAEQPKVLNWFDLTFVMPETEGTQPAGLTGEYEEGFEIYFHPEIEEHMIVRIPVSTVRQAE